MDDTILIVDNNNRFRAALREWLEMMLPHGVIDVGSAEEALDIVKTYEPRVVIMDIKLPKMNGIEATRRIKKDHPETHVVMVTNHEQAILQNLAEDAGASAFVAKSASNTTLLPILTSLFWQNGSGFNPSTCDSYITSGADQTHNMNEAQANVIEYT